MKKEPEFFGLRYSSDEAFEGSREWLQKNGSLVFDRARGWPYLKEEAELVPLPISALYQHLTKNRIGLFDFCWRGSSVLEVLRCDFLSILSALGFRECFNVGNFVTEKMVAIPDWVWFFPKHDACVRDLGDVGRVIAAGLPFAMSSRYFLIARGDVYEELVKVRIARTKWHLLEKPKDWVI